ncbi:Iron(3+)-hydroxamate-binding protein YxeB precursor [Metalysinibacillus saudimassiliensis]|uniref:Iron(3+)-hydroxamate-binding protein YxeB n=1 Tax=Metalysinibacillus saudimassiliensis TaxID=1461583 RepID=A0A078M7D5_9BACL|nr:Iron(3+)-hydroxamate-binding protein YxeB precursor [Metalysinibacillus saudimassiliensis]
MKKWLMVLMVLMLAACSAKEEPATDAKTDTREIETVMGKVTVPSNPQRVIVDWDLGHVIALGVEPVGASKTTLEFGQLLKQFVTDKTDEIGRDGQVSYEKVLELEPDLIITWNRDQVAEYEKIAPTVVFDTTQYDGVHEQLTAMGEILNRQNEAKDWLADYDQRVAKAKAQIKASVPKDATFTIIDSGTVKDAIVVGKSGERGGLAAYGVLEMKAADKIQRDIIDKKESRAEVSWESIQDFAGDYIFLITQQGDNQDELPSVWQSLDAVKNGRVIELKVKEYFTGDPISTLLQAEDMAAKVAELK